MARIFHFDSVQLASRGRDLDYVPVIDAMSAVLERTPNLNEWQVQPGPDGLFIATLAVIADDLATAREAADAALEAAWNATGQGPGQWQTDMGRISRLPGAPDRGLS